MRSKFLSIALAGTALVSLNVMAQDYPAANKTITFVLPYAAGGP
ncbi:MAG: tripartite tricarboxylate transporter substrate binding protein BugD, partial [Betaproteobacteria bacterium]|nr:tripartite tricarboxylate transporter substrate binding protein BugD [Betaproteobacteria bacterium]